MAMVVVNVWSMVSDGLESSVEMGEAVGKTNSSGKTKNHSRVKGA